jgi:hypothetical protein
MNQVSDYLTDPWIDPAVEQLDDEKHLGISLVAFSRTLVDRPDNWKKVVNSYAGHAADLHKTLVLRELQMWCCRVWDKTGHSLPVLAPRMKEKTDQIMMARQAAHPDWSDKQLGVSELPAQIGSFLQSIVSISDESIVSELRVLRNEHFAHLTKRPIKKRKLLESDGKSGYSYNEVIELAERSIVLISEAILIWRFHSHADSATSRLLTKYYETYWRLLPNFSELEEAERIDRIARNKR